MEQLSPIPPKAMMKARRSKKRAILASLKWGEGRSRCSIYFVQDCRFNKKDFKVYENTQEIILKTIAGKDHEEELTKVTAVYGGTDLQRYKLEPQLSLHSSRHGAVRQWGTTSDLTFLISWTFFNHSKMFAKSYFVRFAHLVSLCLSGQLQFRQRTLLLHLNPLTPDFFRIFLQF